MGHKNKNSIIRQTEEALASKLAIGQSKHLDKSIARESGSHQYNGKIYSYGTF